VAIPHDAAWVLANEARALLVRLGRVEPLARTLPRVAAAQAPPGAAELVDRQLLANRGRLRREVERFLAWLRGGEAGRASAAEGQRRFAALKLSFGAVLTELDLFADALVQRAEHGYGTWLAGLDALAADALRRPGAPYAAPPVVTYLDRGHGAAIRRARTRLPGGGRSPVAVIRLPRERLVGSGLASSLVHEVGHQGAALLGLVGSLGEEIAAAAAGAPAGERMAWRLWRRWISEIVADFWSLGLLGVAASQGLIGVLSLPRFFVFRVSPHDVHPFPWARARLSLALGELLYPDPQWRRLARLWQGFYPPAGLPRETLGLLAALERSLPRFVRLLAGHRPPSLGGRTLAEFFPVAARQPRQLRRLFRRCRRFPAELARLPPTLAFAVLGQGKQDGRLAPGEDSATVARLLDFWALNGALRPPQKHLNQRAAGGANSFAAAA
jgi:hypothetical protein